MAKVIGDLMAPGGKYLKDGEEKTRWLKCGIVLETDKGLRVKIESIPVEWDGWLNVFDKEKPATKPVQQTSESDEPF